MKEEKISKKQLDRHIERAKIAAAKLEPLNKDGKLYGQTKKIHGAGIMAMASTDGRHFIYMVPELLAEDTNLTIKGWPAIEVFPEDEMFDTPSDSE